jgi:hypothetical protein
VKNRYMVSEVSKDSYWKAKLSSVSRTKQRDKERAQRRNKILIEKSNYDSYVVKTLEIKMADGQQITNSWAEPISNTTKQ